MAGKLAGHSYGKHRVRVSKVRRPRQAPPREETHEFVEVTVDIELEGDFDASYLNGDNQRVIATDTCKNIVYVLAKEDPMTSIETFGLALVEHLVNRYDQVSGCRAKLRERIWRRLRDSRHGFLADGSMTPTATVAMARGEAPVVVAGVEQLLIAKTTESGFADFHRSEHRTLADTDDRILATEVTARWEYAPVDIDYVATRQAVIDALLTRFLDHYSRSVQETLLRMGQAALDACDGVAEITLTLPNKHHILADLGRFGLENPNEVFVVTDEPYGYITATVER